MTHSILKFLQHPWLYLLNLKEKYFHHPSDAEINLIRATNLFDHLNQNEFSELQQNLNIIYCRAHELIFEEGSIGDALYIVAEGSVRVFTRNSAKEKIVLARLDKGSYFGEQALIGQANKSRNASIETITKTTLIKIHEKIIMKMIQKDVLLKEKLIQLGKKQLFDNISKVVDAYEDLQTYLKRHEYNIIGFAKHAVIFNKNDKADYAYIILEGSVSIETGVNENLKKIILSKGHIFGELAVMLDLLRTGTAIAQEYTRVVRIDKTTFKRYYEEHPKLQKLLSVLSKIYALPNRDTAVQVLGKIKNIYTVTTTYQLSNGRSVIATNAENNFFMMVEPNHDGEIYSYKKKAVPQIELTIKDNIIVGVKCFGTWSDLSNVCAFILDKKPVNENLLSHFLESGKFKSKEYENSNMICACLSVDEAVIANLIEQGHKSLATISEQCGACTVCGGCRNKILDMLGQNLWLPAIMTRITQHSDHVASYNIEPTVGVFNTFIPGEHIVIQMKIGKNWVERSFMLSDLGDKGKHRITIKKEHGIFTEWLCSHPAKHFLTHVSQPQGNFKLILDSNNPLVCFARDIGITPFVTFAHYLLENQPTRLIHIIYFASEGDFILLDELAEIAASMPALKITLVDRPTTSTKKIGKLIQDHAGADIYICGPEGFEKTLLKSLRTLNVREDKIHLEKITYATTK